MDKFSACLVVAVPVLALFPPACVSVNDGFPPGELVGRWEGPSAFSRRGARETVVVSIRIFPDRRVEGAAGGARLVDCVVSRNRGWLGRKLGIKTDYVIRGFIEGAVVPSDVGGRRRITMPFDVREGELAGGIAALTQRWWECCPEWLFTRLRVPRKGVDADEGEERGTQAGP